MIRAKLQQTFRLTRSTMTPKMTLAKICAAINIINSILRGYTNGFDLSIPNSIIRMAKTAGIMLNASDMKEMKYALSACRLSKMKNHTL